MEAPPKPRILMFLQGVILLFTIGSIFAVIYDLLPFVKTHPTFMPATICRVLSIPVCLIAIIGINGRKRYGRLFGVISFISFIVLTALAMIWYFTFASAAG